MVGLIQTKEQAKDVLEACKTEFPSQWHLKLYLLIEQTWKLPDLAGITALLDCFENDDQEIHALATVAMVLQPRDVQTGEKVAGYVTSHLENPKVLNVLAAMMPLFPIQLVPAYTAPGCKLQLLHYAADKLLHMKLLLVVSASCIDQEARKFNTENFLPFLLAGASAKNPEMLALSVLCITKLWSFSAIEKLISVQQVLLLTRDLLRNPALPQEAMKNALEALAYLSLHPSIRSSLRSDDILVDLLVEVVKKNENSADTYGALLVLGNLSQIKEPGQSKERKTVNYLKSVSVPGNDQSQDDEGNLKAFAALLIEKQLVGAFKKLEKLQLAKLAVAVLYNVAFGQDRAGNRKIVQQGGLAFVMRYLTSYSQMNKQLNQPQAISAEQPEIEARLKALRALAFLSRSVDPKLAFGEFDVKTAVPFLLELLGKSIQFGVSSEELPESALSSLLSPLDKFWALLALTNLCARPDKSLNVLMINRLFDQHLKDLMIDSGTPDIQRATWELINNLVLEPLMLAKFFNPENQESMRHLDILVKMLHLPNEQLQVVIAGILANATMEYDLILLVILAADSILDRVVKISADILQKQAHSDALLLRLGTFLGNLLESALDLPQYAKLQTNGPLLAGFKAVLQSTDNSEVFELFSEIVKMLTDS